MARSVAEKMGVRAGSRVYVEGAPDDVVAALGLPAVRRSAQLRGEFDHVQLFVLTRRQLERRFPAGRDHLAVGGALWVSWPKGRGLGGDLTLPVVIEVGYSYGMVESTTLAVDATWSAMKFTRPVPGRTYSNSYGTLR